MVPYEGFMKSFETPKRSVKKKLQLVFSLCPGSEQEGSMVQN